MDEHDPMKFAIAAILSGVAAVLSFGAAFYSWIGLWQSVAMIGIGSLATVLCLASIYWTDKYENPEKFLRSNNQEESEMDKNKQTEYAAMLRKAADDIDSTTDFAGFTVIAIKEDDGGIGVHTGVYGSASQLATLVASVAMQDDGIRAAILMALSDGVIDVDETRGTVQ